MILLNIRGHKSFHVRQSRCELSAPWWGGLFNFYPKCIVFYLWTAETCLTRHKRFTKVNRSVPCCVNCWNFSKITNLPHHHTISYHFFICLLTEEKLVHIFILIMRKYFRVTKLVLIKKIKYKLNIKR